MNKKYLFLFTLGPVQSFIAQARKTQDLYAGSKLLSELVKIAIEKVGQENIIFPYVKGKNLKTEIDSLPNRFIAEIDEPESELSQLGKVVENTVRDKFKQIADGIFNDLVKSTDKNYRNLYSNFEKQISQHLDIHWLFLKQTGDYAKDFQEIEQLLGAIKNVRTFEQNEETGRKCSMDGERNALFCAKGSKNSLQLKPNWGNLSKGEEDIVNDFNNTLTEINKGNLTGNEGLSAVSLVKRLYKDEENQKFPSTARIALLDLLLPMEAEKQNGKFVLKDYKLLFDGGRYFDEQLCYIDNLTEDYFKKNGLSEILKVVKLEHIKEVHKEVFRGIKLPKYYALIAFDADRMGEWLSGNKINGDLKEFHKKLSGKLIEFGKWATNYLATPLGNTVYAGGDDFLGFVNLKHLFSVMKELRSKFDEIVNCSEVTNFIKGEDRISFSAGIVVAHYKMPLGEVLTWAKRMEHEAKELDKNNKDAFAIAVLKKSGEVIQTKSKWKDTNGGYLTENIEYLCLELEKGKDESKKQGFSPTFIKNLNRELDIFADYDSKKAQVDLADILACEMPRLMKRASLITDKDSKKESVQDLYNKLDNLYWGNSALNSNEKMPNFLDILNISDFLTRKITQD